MRLATPLNAHTHLSDSRPCIVLTPPLSPSHFISHSPSFFLSLFFSSVSHHLLNFPLSLSFSLCSVLPLVPVAVSLHHLQFFTPQQCLYESRSDSLSAAGLPLVICAGKKKTENRIELCWACSTALHPRGDRGYFTPGESTF